jgi:hypothetical protein
VCCDEALTTSHFFFLMGLTYQHGALGFVADEIHVVSLLLLVDKLIPVVNQFFLSISFPGKLAKYKLYGTYTFLLASFSMSIFAITIMHGAFR